MMRPDSPAVSAQVQRDRSAVWFSPSHFTLNISRCQKKNTFYLVLCVRTSVPASVSSLCLRFCQSSKSSSCFRRRKAHLNYVSAADHLINHRTCDQGASVLRPIRSKQAENLRMVGCGWRPKAPRHRTLKGCNISPTF